MSKMYRLNHDGTVSQVEDTTEVCLLGPRYSRSTMRAGQWIFLNANLGVYQRRYIDESEVPNIIKLASMIGN